MEHHFLMGKAHFRAADPSPTEQRSPNHSILQPAYKGDEVAMMLDPSKKQRKRICRPRFALSVKDPLRGAKNGNDSGTKSPVAPRLATVNEEVEMHHSIG
jgi:hypothetical protein